MKGLGEEAQLPVKTGRQQCIFCSYVTFCRRNDLHLRLSPPKPTSDDSASLLRTQRINFSMRPTAARGHARVLVYLYLILRNCFRKPRKNVQDER